MDAIPVLDWYEHGKGESTICRNSHLYPSFPSLSVIPISIRHSHLHPSFPSLSVIPAKAGTQNSVSEHSHMSTSNSDEPNKTT